MELLRSEGPRGRVDVWSVKARDVSKQVHDKDK